MALHFNLFFFWTRVGIVSFKEIGLVDGIVVITIASYYSCLDSENGV